ncbi:MAG TPA: hypothetical protein EYP69_01525 [Bacteroidales bacterium]|nr:hypothetical protein [Bacteroidales bacterium]
MVFILLLTILTNCKINYSFTGTSISPEVKTFSVQEFPNRAPMYVPTLCQSFSEKLKDKLLSQTSLQPVSSGVGDLDFSGEITEYKITPIAVTGNETAAQNRLTISIKVIFTNTKDPKQDFEKKFSNYEDFDATESIENVEEELIDQILEKITEDIFNNSVANW